MVRGKSGFQRIIWAFKNLLDRSVNWLFCDVKGQNDGSGPISVHQSIAKVVKPQRCILPGAEVPNFPPITEQSQYEDATELLEWLTLAMNQSPRIQSDDSIDSYLSRYRVPAAVDISTDTSDARLQDLVKLRWHGLIHPAFVQAILLATLKASGQDWFAFSATAFDGRAYTFLQNKEQTMTWEYQD